MRTHVPALVLLLPLTGCGDDDAAAVVRTRPVTVATLTEVAPAARSRVTGVAEPYRQSALSFQVSGQVAFVIDNATEVVGAEVGPDGELLLDDQGAPVQEGDIVAALDTTRFDQAVTAIELKLASSRLALEAQRVDLDKVASADRDSAVAQAEAAELDVDSANAAVSAARAASTLAESVLAKNKELVKSGAVSQIVLEESENDAEAARAALDQARTAVSAREKSREGAAAAVAKAEGAILLKQSQIEQTKAEIAELEQSLVQAQTDLDDCVLRAPFSGRITAVNVGRGAYVQPGSTVATLTLLNPMQISVSVSAEDDRRLVLGSRVRVFPSVPPPGAAEGEGMLAAVFEKGQVADPETRTFRVGLIAGNREVLLNELPEGPEPALTEWLFPAFTKGFDGLGPLYVNTDCLMEEDGKTFVLRLPGLSRFGEPGRATMSVLFPEKVEVTLGDGYFELVNWELRELASAGDLQDGDMLVEGPTPAHLEGTLIDRKDWVFRPGDLVRVDFDLGEHPSGIYVPVQAISERNGETSMFLLDGDQARRVAVKVFESYRELRRVEGVGVEPGARVVVKGAHFLRDGDTVSVVGELQL